MSGRPLPSTGGNIRGPIDGAAAGRTGGYLLGGSGPRDRVPPAPRRIARRRFLITLTKWVLPIAAMALLASIALYPEIRDATTRARLSMNHISGEVDGGRLLGARYNGVDEKGRPYTITADIARQIDPDRVGLTMPKGDITLQNGTWLMLNSKRGIYMQHLDQLDLSKDVTLYRDDGTTMHTESASIDMKAGAAAGSQPVHAEGPFGVLDAQGFTLMDKGAAIDFPGPAHLVLNGSGN
ncbi:LPS export ABC transporter periplasmic protein LptC [Rhodopila sp.]|uniref:LPS export ABC transporter periplasmic protein LptC n=1 Tax=Rhodopila sp. TaxID=2480087 RepID=UPI003D100179